MVTGFSYYPKWKKRGEDRGRLLVSERYKGIRVLRGYLFVPAKVSTLTRVLHEASFSLFAAINFLRAGRPDVIVIFTPPFFLAFVALLAAKIWRRPLVINIQDLPLDAAMALGMVKPSLVSRFLLGLEAYSYRQADQVVTISGSMLEKVWAKGVQKNKTELVPNWIDVASYAKPTAAGRFLSQHPQAKDKLTVGYAGNLGIKQGVDVLVRLAKLVEEDARYHFFIIGDGADKPRLLALVETMNLRNLTFLPFMEPEAYREMLTDIDVVFVAQRSGAGNNCSPSKLLGLMALQKPLLVAADNDSELAKTIVTGGFGLVSPYDDLPALRQNMEIYAANETMREQTGRRGLDMVQSFDRHAVLGAWESSIKELIEH